MIKPLNTHYSFENPASVYDEEALTALELAGRQGAKINEVIADQNQLRQETEEHLETQDKTIDDRMDIQDLAIEKIRSVTVPADVKAEFERNLEDGTFEDMVDEYAGELTSRVDNLLGSVTEGSTTLDAELLDIRSDANGYIYDNAGGAVRALDKRFLTTNNLLDNAVSVSGFLNKGKISPNVDTNYLTSHFIPVTPGKTYCFGNNGTATEMRFVNLFNSDKSYIVDSELNNVRTFTVENENAKYVRITYSALYEKAHLNVDTLLQFEPHFYNGIEGFKQLEEKLENTKNGFIESPNLIKPEEILTGVFDNYGELVEGSYNLTGFIPVVPGETYYFSRDGVGKQMRFISAYNYKKAFIGYLPDNSGNVHEVTIDNAACTFIRVTFGGTTEKVQLEKDGVTPYMPAGLLVPFERVVGVEETTANTKWHGKKVAWIGSSITQGYKWCEVVNAYFGFNATNCGVGGTAMCNESVASMCNVERLLGEYSNVTDPNTGEVTANGVAIPQDTEIIFVEAGTNDWARNWPLGEKSLTFNASGEMELDTSTFYGACHQFFKNVTELYPNAQIIAVGTPYGKMANRGVFPNKYGLLNSQGLQSVEYGDALAEVAGMWGCYAFNFGREMGIHDNNIAELIPDGLHLNNQEAYTRAGNVIINKLLSVKV